MKEDEKLVFLRKAQQQQQLFKCVYALFKIKVGEQKPLCCYIEGKIIVFVEVAFLISFLPDALIALLHLELWDRLTCLEAAARGRRSRLEA